MKNIIIFLYAIFLLLFSIFSYAFIDPNLPYLKSIYSDFAFSNRFLTTIFYISSVIIFFIFYGVFIYLGTKRKLNLKEIIILLGVTVVGLLFSYPAMLSYDIFNYIITSKVLFFYHENPYVVMPIELVADPLLAFTHAANKIALYAPFWLLLTGIPYLLGLGNFIVILFSFKLFSTLFYLGSVFLIWKISRNILSLILFSFNPLIVIETLVGSHNDIAMIFLALLSFFLLMQKKIFFGALFFVLSIFIKYSTILLIPAFLFIVWKIIKNKEIHFQKIFYYSSLLMYVAFLLSPIREEIYPWYAIWFISFAFLVPNKKILLYVSIAFSFSLLLRHAPYMLTGTYVGQTPLIKEIISFTPPALIFIYYVLKKKV